MSTIFKKIIDKEIPADIVYEDEQCLAFKDIKPVAPVHVLLIPKKEIPSVQDLSPEDQSLMGHLMVKIPEIAKLMGIADTGYRLIANCGEHGRQEVPHLHFHILGGAKMKHPLG